MNKVDTYKMEQSIKDKAIHDLRERVGLLESKMDVLLSHIHLYLIKKTVIPRDL